MEDMTYISKMMDALERQWFAAERVVRSAHEELSVHVDDNPRDPLVRAVRDRLEQAERAKQDIMREIEAIEDSLIS